MPPPPVVIIYHSARSVYRWMTKTREGRKVYSISPGELLPWKVEQAHHPGCLRRGELGPEPEARCAIVTQRHASRDPSES